MTEDQKKVWHAALTKTRKITDGLSMPIDKPIVETVAIMQLLGFRTTMSCGGHLRRATGGPYVMFVSLKAGRYERQYKQIANSQDPDSKKAYKKARAANLIEQLRLFELLEKFYETRTTAFAQRLVLRTMGFSTNRLELQSADISQIMNMQLRKQILAANRREMQSFADFLKAEYFKALPPMTDGRVSAVEQVGDVSR